MNGTQALLYLLKAEPTLLPKAPNPCSAARDGQAPPR